MKREATLIVSILNLVVLEAVTLFSYDSATSLAVTDDIAEPVTLTTPVSFHGNDYTQIYISENGMVTFEDGFYGGITHPLTKPWLAPFGADVYPNQGEITHQIVNTAGSAELTKATDLIAEIYPDDSFQAAEVFVVTWLHVKNLASSNTENTFQLALCTDGSQKSYAIFLYEKIEWYPAVIGVSAGDSSSFYRVCGTDKYGVTFFPIKSNSQCATDGALVFRLHDSAWNAPGYTCTPVYTAITCTAKPGIPEENRDQRCTAA